jgi:hypothetical protein
MVLLSSLVFLTWFLSLAFFQSESFWCLRLKTPNVASFWFLDACTVWF